MTFRDASASKKIHLCSSTVWGNFAGNAGLGLAIGAASGLAGGYLYGKHKVAEQAAYEEGYKQSK